MKKCKIFEKKLMICIEGSWKKRKEIKKYISIKTEEIIKRLEEENKVIPAIRDCVFKKIMQNEKLKGYITTIISEIYDINYEYLYNNIRFMNTELMKDNYYLKNNHYRKYLQR